MTEATSIACSLRSNDLRSRLDEIAAVGASHLIERSVEGRRHLLRFHANKETRRDLEAIVAAEAECCSFLALSLDQLDDELVLEIEAPDAGQPFADALTVAFARDRG